MKTIKTYEEFNFRRYSNPWVCEFNNGKYDFAKKVGGYTGRYGAGEAGALYVTEPKENQVYAYGQKDNRGGHTERNFVIYQNGEFIEIDNIKAFELSQN